VVRALADARDPDSGRTALHFAALGAQAHAADALLELGADPNARDPQGCTPLHLAAGWGSARVLGLLLLRGADKRATDHHGRTPSDLARRNERHAELK
jgi:ankyrin repeat protein